MSECPYQPLFGRVIIEREVTEKKGSVLIPEHLRRKHARCEGKIVAKGPAADETISIGDHVIFGRHSGTWLDATYSAASIQTQQGLRAGLQENDDGKYFLCQDEDLLAIVKE